MAEQLSREQLTKMLAASQKKFNAWQQKNKFLENQITALEKNSDYPVFAISSFLLKTQLIEFQLKQLIFAIDMHVAFSNRSTIIILPIRKPDELDDKRMTLGVIKTELSHFKSKELDTLLHLLGQLLTKRNQFVHKLFSSQDSVKSLVNKAKSGLLTSQKVLEEINVVNLLLKKNDPFLAWHKGINNK